MNLKNMVFSGQGSQFIGMGQDLYNAHPIAKELFDMADQHMGISLSDICFNGPEDTLNQTQYTQVAIFITSACIFNIIKEQCNINAMAGHSLGEITAYYAAGVLDAESALNIVIKRGELMGQAAQQTDGSMAAIIGMDADTISSTLNTIEGVSIANYNSPVQCVISGTKQAVSTACQALQENGAKRVVPLPVSGAFHSPLMASAVEPFKEYLTQFTFNNATNPIILNRTAQPETNGTALQQNLAEQIESPVRWIEIIELLAKQNPNFIEIGPGKVLSGLIKKINRELSVQPTSTLETIQNMAQDTVTQ
jgi:[acyl-carrier-protein] S-malonyltransferase